MTIVGTYAVNKFSIMKERENTDFQTTVDTLDISKIYEQSETHVNIAVGLSDVEGRPLLPEDYIGYFEWVPQIYRNEEDNTSSLTKLTFHTCTDEDYKNSFFSTDIGINSYVT